MFLTPTKKLRYNSTKLWCFARSCQGPYVYTVDKDREILKNKPHVKLESYKPKPQPQQMSFPLMLMGTPPLPEEEPYD